MTRIYGNRKLAWRMNISALVTVFAILYGIFELWMAYRAGPDAGYGYLFGIFFIGGGIYGMRQIVADHSDGVVALDADAGGKAAIVVWRPFRSKRIETTLDSLTEWRPYARKSRGAHMPALLADHPDHPRPLRFDIDKGVAIASEFRTLVGEPLASLEARAQ